MGEIRYRALRIWLIRLLMLFVAGPVSLGMLGVGAILLTLDPVAGLLGALMCWATSLLATAGNRTALQR